MQDQIRGRSRVFKRSKSPLTLRGPGRFTPIEEEIEQLSDFVFVLQWVPHLDVGIDDVVIAPADARPRYVPSLDEVSDDSLGRPLRDPRQLGNVADPDLGIAGDAEEHLRVARDEAPRLLILIT
jgi:hypothetical protein